MFNNMDYSGKICDVGDFCEFAREARLILGGEHFNNLSNNFTLSASAPAQYLVRSYGGNTKASTKGPIFIGEGTIVSYRATILSGANIAPGVVIGAGSVVTKASEPFSVYAGVPAKKIAERPLESRALLRDIYQMDCLSAIKSLALGKPEKNFSRRNSEDRLVMAISYKDPSGEGGDFEFRILGAIVGGKIFPLLEGSAFFKYAIEAATGKEGSEYDWEPDPLALEMG